MDNIVPDFYKRYGMHVNYFRMIPLSIDGLKPVERRTLLSAYDIARDKLTKCAKLDGYCIGNYHPHGSVYGTIVQMVNQGFLDGQGNFGTNIGVDPCGPAAMRYTEVKLNKEFHDMVFRLIKYVPYKDGEMAGDKEPVFLPTMLPICLLGKTYTQGIGFGYKTLIPCYHREDLLNRLLFLKGKRKIKTIIKPITDCDILSTDAELETLLTTGKASIKVKGKITLEPHLSKIKLHSWPMGKSFEALINNKKISEYLSASDIGYQDLSYEDKTEIEFEVLKQRNRDVIYKSFVKDLEAAITGSISFDTIVITNNSNGDPVVTPMSIDDMLLNTFTMYTDINKIMLETEKQNLLNSIVEYKNLLTIRPYLANEIKNKIVNINETMQRISDSSKVIVEDIKKLFTKYNINKLLTLDVDEAGMEAEVNYYQTKLDNLETYVTDQY